MRFLFVDRILKLIPGQEVFGIKHVTEEDSYLNRDEYGKLYFVPSLIGETLGQLAAWNVMLSNNFTLRPVAGVVAQAKLYRHAYVGETIALEAFIDCLDTTAVQYNGIARVGNTIIFTVSGALGPLLPMSEFINASEVREQFAAINRPGEWPISNPLIDIPPSISNPQLPNPMLHFEQVIACQPAITLTAAKRITKAAPYFLDHFPKKPVLPMTILLECKLNLAYEFAMRAGFNRNYKVSELRNIKMSSFIHPGDVVLCHVKVTAHNDNILVLHYRAEVNGKRVCVLELEMTTNNDPLSRPAAGERYDQN